MALLSNFSDPPLPGKKPARPGTAQRKGLNAAAESNPKWDEDSPSYLDAVQSSLASLTEEEKEAFHLSLQG